MYKRILSLAPSNTEILLGLGAGSQVVGVTALCDYPVEAKSFPKVGSWINAHDLAKMGKVKPDLVLTSMFIPPEVRDWCQKYSVELVNVNPQTLVGVYESMVTIGRLTGHEIKAEKMAETLRLELNKIKDRSAKILAGKSRPKIYTEEFPEPPTVAANWVPELIEIAGGTAMAKPGIYSYPVFIKDVKLFDPDLIVLHWCGFGLKSRPGDLIKRPEWNQIPAVKNTEIFYTDDVFLNRPGPRLWQGALRLQSIVQQWLQKL